MALKTVPFNVALTFSRPAPADYENINGDTQTAGVDEPRFNYNNGVAEGLMLDASLSETAAINDIPNFNANSGTWVIKADLDKSKPIPGSGFDEFMEGSGALVFVYSNGTGKCWADGEVLYTVDSFSAAEPGFLSNGGLAKIQSLKYYPYAWSEEKAAAESNGEFSIFYSPLSLFANGENGAWYDPSDLTTLFQDAAGTIPVTTDGDPVGLMLDKSGNDNHASQATASNRPIYRTDGTLHWLEFDGVDDLMVASGFSTLSDDCTVFLAVEMQQFDNFSPAFNLPDGLRLYPNDGVGLAVRLRYIGENLNEGINTNQAGVAQALSLRSTTGDQQVFRGETLIITGNEVGTVNPDGELEIGAATGVGQNANQNLYSLLCVSGDKRLSITGMSGYLASKSGVIL